MKNLFKIYLFGVFVVSFLVANKTTAYDKKNKVLLTKEKVTQPKRDSILNQQLSLREDGLLFPTPPSSRKPKSRLLDALVFLDIRGGAYPCGLPISDLVGVLDKVPLLLDNEKNQLMQIAIDSGHCCSADSDLWWMYEGEEYKQQEQALRQTCHLKQIRQNYTFVNILKAGFLSTCPALAKYINTMTEPSDSRLGVLLIIEKAKELKCGDPAQLHAINKEVEKESKRLLQARYNIDYRLFEVDF